MSIRYVIGPSVEFWPENHQLVVRGSRDLAVTLHIPASRCLQLLLERRYSLVLQQDFYPYVWGEAGATVSASTLYQNIALLRKALKSTGEGNETLVVTEYKKGFRLNDNFTVLERQSDENETSLEQEPAIEEPAQTFIVAPPVTKPELIEVKTINRIRAKSLYMYSSIAILTLLLCAQLYNWGYMSAFSPPLQFTKLSTQAGCTIYSNMDADSAADRLKIVNSANIDCQRTPYIYLSGDDYRVLTSFLVCDRKLSDPVSPQCRTYNYSERHQ